MNTRSWAGLRTWRTSRFFSAYLAVVLLTAMIGPGLAVYAAEGDATGTVSPDVPIVEAPWEIGDPGAPTPTGESAEAYVPSAPASEYQAAPAEGPQVAAIAAPDFDKDDNVGLSSDEVGGPESGDLIVRKFEDLDEDGRWDEAEPTLGGWQFTLYDGQNVEIGSGTTDANGWLMFSGLAAGDVTVVETLKSGWENTTPVTQTVTIVAGEVARLYFGNIREAEAPETGAVLVHKFQDCDEDGAWDEDEPLLADWYFRVRDLQGVQLDAGFTGEDGMILFEGLPEGDVTVTETLKPGWNNTTPLSRTVTVVAGETTHVFFGNARCVEVPETGCLVIRKYEDLDRDCRWDEGEPPLGGWVFTLYDVRGAEIGSGTTDANGWLRFEGVPEGAVCAEETLREGWINTTPLCQRATVVAASSVHLCFGNAREVEAPETGDLVVRTFEDLDEDGTWDDGEPVLAGRDFTVDNEAGASVGSGSTDANGWIMWEGLPEGDVTVTQAPEPGWTNTTPLSQGATIVAGQTAYLYFGGIAEAPGPEAGDVIVHAFLDANENGGMDAGEQSLSGWSFTVRDGTGAVVETGVTNASGVLAFTLPAGVYTATETLTSGWANTTSLTQGFTIVAGQTQNVYFGNVQRFLPFTPGADPAQGDPFLPFTGGEYVLIVAAALVSATAGVTLRRRARR